ncbi:hypothetical protein [Ponticaulis profundi]|uniref:Uncharacterized protein n=1 Tax=Ponticaulis profundi TaxID=2665222 RepID=A0ABW1S5V6_9PROT
MVSSAETMVYAVIRMSIAAQLKANGYTFGVFAMQEPEGLQRVRAVQADLVPATPTELIKKLNRVIDNLERVDALVSVIVCLVCCVLEHVFPELLVRLFHFKVEVHSATRSVDQTDLSSDPWPPP